MQKRIKTIAVMLVSHKGKNPYLFSKSSSSLNLFVLVQYLVFSN